MCATLGESTDTNAKVLAYFATHLKIRIAASIRLLTINISNLHDVFNPSLAWQWDWPPGYHSHSSDVKNNSVSLRQKWRTLVSQMVFKDGNSETVLFWVFFSVVSDSVWNTNKMPLKKV